MKRGLGPSDVNYDHTPLFVTLVEQLMRSQPDPPPDELHHYTTATGLLGIVTSGTLRATGIRFMNDARECVHALELVMDALDRSMKRSRDSYARALLKQMRIMAFVFQFRPMYVACFSELPDQLSQWRAYGRGGGYAIGLSTRTLAALSTEPRGGLLVKCIYDKTTQLTHIRKAIGIVLAGAKEARPASSSRSPKGLMKGCEQAFAGFLSLAASVFKDAAFEEEQEWRVIVQGDLWAPHKRQFRADGGVIVPYVELGIPGARAFPIESIVVGPGAHQDAAMAGLRNLFEERRLTTRTIRSEIPYRTWATP